MDKEARERLDYEYEKKFDLFKKIYTFLDGEQGKNRSLIWNFFELLGKDIFSDLLITFDLVGLTIKKIDLNK